MAEPAVALVSDLDPMPDPAMDKRARSWAELSGAIPKTVDRIIPVSNQLQGLFPQGGLRRGSVLTVVGSTTVALSVVAHATQSGFWCAAVGMPDLGAVAAADIGVDLDRFPIVPNPGTEWPTVVGALVDGFDLILMRANKSLAPSATRKIEARMRQSGTTLILLAPMPNVWHQTDYVIREAGVSYEGIGQGHGVITRRNFIVMLEGRGAAARPRSAQLAV